MSIREKLNLVMGIIGDKRMTRNELFDKVKKTHDVTRNTVQRWILLLQNKGLLGRIRTKARGIEYEYFRMGEEKPSEESDREPFTIVATCPGCGSERQIAFEGDTNGLATFHSSETWGCSDCGDFVRLSDCYGYAELLRNYRNVICSRNPDLDCGLTAVTVGRL